jgi:hypothetical protein
VEYTHAISLNKPAFGSSFIGYSEGILKSTNNTVSSTSFEVQVNRETLKLSGTMNFSYSNVGINAQEKIRLKVYPNPANDLLFIEHENPATVILYDMFGRDMACRVSTGKTEINISHLPNGIYNVIIFSEGRIIGNTKIVKQY